ncbi:MAG: hypothetical protein EPN84_00200 [Legionella sp.]|nr:MAG: hypothetical protein EPN84_00200 [Legionella sp.]
MKLFGFDISSKGIKLPFSNIRIPIPLLLLFSQFATAAKTPFPKDGTFAEEVAFVDSLPRGCSLQTSYKLMELLNAENPFSQLTKLPEGTKGTVRRHEFDKDNGVVFRREMSNEARANENDIPMLTDVETVLIGGVGNGAEEVTFKFERTAEGLLKVKSKDHQPILQHANGLLAQKVGLTVSVETAQEHCFQTNGHSI